MNGRITVNSAARAAGRIVTVSVFAGVLGVCGVQFEHIIAKNVSLSNDLDSERTQTSDLRDKVRHQQRAIERLGDPRGAIEDIHEQLRLVGPNEQMIYVHGDATPLPDGWAKP